MSILNLSNWPNLVKPKALLVFTCIFYVIFSLTLIHPVNRNHEQYKTSTYGKYQVHIDEVWDIAYADAQKPFSEVRDHYLFFKRNPGLFKFIVELSIRAGAKTPTPLQLILIFLVTLGIVAQFYWMKLFFKHPIFPVMGCLIILGTHFLTLFGSTIHQHPYNYSFFNFSLLFLVLHHKTKLKRYFVATMLCYFIMCQSYYMFWVSTYLMMVGINWSYGVKLISLKNFILGLIPVATVIIVLLNMIYVYGSLDEGWPVLRKIMKARVLGVVEDGSPQKPMHLKDYLHYPITVSSRIERYFYIPGFIFLILTYPLQKMRKFNQSKLDYKVFYFALPAALSWYILVWEHTDVHQVVGRYSFFLWMIFLSFFSYELWHWCKAKQKDPTWFFMPFILIYAGYGFLWYNMRLFVMNIYRIIVS